MQYTDLYSESDDETISITSEECYICDQVEECEGEYIECVNNKYYIGSYCIISNRFKNDTLLFGIKINTPTFYSFSNYELSTYIYYFSGFQYKMKPTIEIMQLKMDECGVYTAILKTFWIRIIQRSWKKRMVERKKYMINLKKNIISLLTPFQLANQIPKPPGIRGILTKYKLF